MGFFIAVLVGVGLQLKRPLGLALYAGKPAPTQASSVSAEGYSGAGWMISTQ